jgi:hypothetical protein
VNDIDSVSGAGFGFQSWKLVSETGAGHGERASGCPENRPTDNRSTKTENRDSASEKKLGLSPYFE